VTMHAAAPKGAPRRLQVGFMYGADNCSAVPREASNPKV